MRVEWGILCGEIDVSIDIAIAGDRVLENQSKPHNTINRGHTCLVYPRKR